MQASDKPLKVDHYDIFYFETLVRDLIAAQMQPIFAQLEKDHQTVVLSNKRSQEATCRLNEYD